MGEIAKRNMANAIIAGAFLIAMAHFGVTTMLGAHPFWAVKIGYIGVGFGIVVYSLFWVWQGSWVAKLGSFLVLTILSSGITFYGKSRFVAVSGDDFLGGQMWYFGWIAAVGFAFAVLMHILSTRP